VIAQSERFIRVRPKVGETYWFLGRAYSEQKKLDVAMIALAKCYLLKCPVSAKAKQYLDYLYKGQRGNLVGLEKIIQKAREEIGG
jgi:cytochrome c-type biogenesis protein CcmH/NrfG